MLEYFCKTCRELRLYADTGRPTECGNCGGAELEVDALGSARLKQLRFGDAEPDAALTLIILKESQP